MNYELVFLKKEKATLEELLDALNPNTKTEDDLWEISKHFQDVIISELKKKGLTFTVYDSSNEGEFDLLFPTFEIDICYSEVYIVVPYFKENNTEKRAQEVMTIINVLQALGMTGLNEQKKTLISKEYSFQKEFEINLHTES